MNIVESTKSKRFGFALGWTYWIFFEHSTPLCLSPDAAEGFALGYERATNANESGGARPNLEEAEAEALCAIGLAWGELPAFPGGRTVAEEAAVIRYDLSVGRWDMVAFRMKRIEEAGTLQRFTMHDRECGVGEPMSTEVEDYHYGSVRGDREDFHADG